MSAENQAVFLSYASQDAEAVARIAAALRASGVEVWFDKDELVGGDAWDAKIRGQIASCALFVPVISAATQARLEGYFRIEWKLAAQRTHAMADEKAFLLPVVIDDTRDGEAKVPGEFRAVQWTRLTGGETSATEKFCARVGRLLGGDVIDGGPVGDRAPHHRSGLPVRRLWPRFWIKIVAVIAVLGVGGFYGYRWYYQQQETAALAAFNMTPEEPVKKEGRVLAARFENRTGDAALELAGQLVADHVRRRAPEVEWVKDAVAVREADRLPLEATADEMRALAKKTGGDLLVTGHYYKDGNRVFFSGRVLDLNAARIFAELAPIAGEAAALQSALEETAERLLGVAGSVPRVRRGKEDVTKFVNFSVPRRFDATQIVSRGPAEDLLRYRRAYERDPQGSLVSLVLLAFAHAYRDRFAEADAVLAEVEAKDPAQLTTYARELMNWTRATTGGDEAGVERAIETLCGLLPNNRIWRGERINALLRTNKPQAILREFAGVTPGNPAEKLSVVWNGRAGAYFLLQDLPAMEAAGRRLQEIEPESENAMDILAYTASLRGDPAAVTGQLDRYDSLKKRSESGFTLYATVLAVMRRAGRAETPEFAALVRRAERWVDSRPKLESGRKPARMAQAEILYLAGRYAETRQLAEKLAAEFPDDVRIRGLIGTAAARMGDLPAAHATLEWLRALDPKYRFGYELFAQAKICALLGRPDDAMRLLREAFARYSVTMKDFSWPGVLVSPDFDALRTHPSFQEFITPKG